MRNWISVHFASAITETLIIQHLNTDIFQLNTVSACYTLTNQLYLNFIDITENIKIRKILLKAILLVIFGQDL